MLTNPYDYKNRQGIRAISWEDFHGICRNLVAAISIYNPEIILPIGRGGYYSGTLIAHMLQAELFPIYLSRRVKDVITYQIPRWIIKPPKRVLNRRVLIVDEISSTGETITLVTQKLKTLKAKKIRSAVLYSHERGKLVPDYIGLITDSLILNPWDREIWTNKGFQFNPEYKDALQKQHIHDVDSSLLIKTANISIAKGSSKIIND